MDFGYSEEQEIFRKSVREFLKKECPKEKVRSLEEDEKGYSPEMWRKMAELGWMGITLPEEYGGVGGEFMDLALLMEEAGKNILPSPLLSTILCSLSILQYGTKQQKEKFLPKIATGEKIWTVALTEAPLPVYEASNIKLSARLEGDSYVLEGTKIFVPYAHVADYLLVAARTSEEKDPEKGITVLIVDAKKPNIKVEVIPTAAHDKQCEVKFEKVKVSKDNVLGQIDKGWEIVEFILQRGAVLKCAEMLGAAEAVLEMSNNYAKERVQFDRPIGSFQAIQHKLADMLCEVDGLRHLVYKAAWEISVGSPSKLSISLAKVKANEVYQYVCISGIRIHGAIGFTMEHDIGLYFRRVKASEYAFGDSSFHKEIITDELEKYKPPNPWKEE
ncbi:MAG: acyl-CoA dehydrogenase family protein [Candidatus Bathyarchaeota archaeon]